MNIYELNWVSQGEKEWVAANTNIEALMYYTCETGTHLHDFDPSDEIKEVPKSEWSILTIQNTDYDPSDPSDFETQTFEEYMKTCNSPSIVCGTMYK